MSFLDIPLRLNGQKFFADWFNSLRAAGIALESFFGVGSIPQTLDTIANNQASPLSVVEFLLDSSSYRSAHVFVEVRRKTDTNEKKSVGFLKFLYRENSSLWEIIDELGGDDDGVVFTVTAVGQVKYVSDNLTGANYVGEIRFKAIVMNI